MNKIIALMTIWILSMTTCAGKPKPAVEKVATPPVSQFDISELEITQVPKPIVCPHCGSNGPHTYLYGTSTLLYCPMWIDEKGVWHSPDRNITTDYFRCQKCGREFTK